jgi:hypothetical protein
VLRFGDRPGIEQKLRALLTRCQLLRMAMVTAVETRPGTDPDRASFTSALEAARGVCPDGPAGLPRRHRPRRAGQPAARPHRLRCSPQGQCATSATSTATTGGRTRSRHHRDQRHRPSLRGLAHRW